MRNNKMYEPEDKMIVLIRDNYNILQSLGSFGISLGFGDKTVSEVCQEQNVDTRTFLAVVNLTINGHRDSSQAEHLSVPTLLHYLKASHSYYLDFQLPFIRKELKDALDEKDNLAHLIMKLYDEYARAITNHMRLEERLFSLMLRVSLRETVQTIMILKPSQSIIHRLTRSFVS